MKKLGITCISVFMIDLVFLEELNLEKVLISPSILDFSGNI